MKVETEYVFGEPVGERLLFRSDEMAVLMRACSIAAEARKLRLDEDADTLLSEIEHGCRELLADHRGYPVTR